MNRNPRQTCFFCESDEDLETHHIFPQRYGGGDTKENLVDVCPDCHNKLEYLYSDQLFWSKFDMEAAENLPSWFDLDAENVVTSEVDTEEHNLEDFRPTECAWCLRPGPFEESTHQPSGYPAYQCIPCREEDLYVGENYHVFVPASRENSGQ